MQYKTFLLITSLFYFFSVAENFAQNPEEDVQKIIDISEEIRESGKYNKETSSINESSKKAVLSKEYDGAKTWIKNNKEIFFTKNSENSDKINESIKQNNNEKILSDKGNKNAINLLLQNYQFKQEDVKKGQVIHFPLMIFVSSSIPAESLKGLMIQAKKSGGVLVFRGLIGSMRNTSEFLTKLSKDHVSAIIDPRLFDIFKIERVPTFIITSSSIQECEGSNCLVTPKHDRVVGNITLNYALEQIIANEGDTKAFAAQYLKKLDGE